MQACATLIARLATLVMDQFGNKYEIFYVLYSTNIDTDLLFTAGDNVQVV